MSERPPSAHHRLITSGLIILAGSSVINLMNYLFTLVAGRLLSTAEFGEIATLFGLQIILAVPATTIATLGAKYIGQFYGANQPQFIKILASRLQKISFLIGGLTILFFLLFSPVIGHLLKINQLSVVLFGLVIGSSILTDPFRGTLQGLQKFSAYTLLNIIPTASKLVLGILLAYLGFGVPGILIALLIGVLLAIALAGFSIRQTLPASEQGREASFPWAEVTSYAKVILLTNALFALFFNSDLILAKYFFDPETAGRYSALTVVVKIISYGSSAFIPVLLPLVAADSQKNDAQRRRLLKLSMQLVSFFMAVIVAVFLLFPTQVISLLVGSKFLSIAPHLPLFSLALVLSTFSAVIMNYLVATHSRRLAYPLTAVVLTEILGIIIFHSSIAHLVAVNLACNLVLFVGMIVLYQVEQSAHASR